MKSRPLLLKILTLMPPNLIMLMLLMLRKLLMMTSLKETTPRLSKMNTKLQRTKQNTPPTNPSTHTTIMKTVQCQLKRKEDTNTTTQKTTTRLSPMSAGEEMPWKRLLRLKTTFTDLLRRMLMSNPLVRTCQISLRRPKEQSRDTPDKLSEDLSKP